MRKTVDERHQGRTVFDQAAPGVRIGDIAHLLLGDIQQMGQLLPVARRLIEHDDELRVTKHGAGLYGVQKILHILGDGSGIGVALAELPPRGVEKGSGKLVLKHHMELVNKDMGAPALLPV